MISKHKYCTPPANPEINIWRYINFTKFVDLLTNQTLFFSRCDMFEDIFEGTISSQAVFERNYQTSKNGQNDPLESQVMWDNFGKKIIKTFAANCWHMNNHESAAMWKIYLNSQYGVAIQSTYHRLFESLNMTTDPIYLSIVKYKDFESKLIDWDWGNYLNRFLHKRCNYIYEQELRAIIRSEDGYNLNEGGANIKVDINLLIENIYISPSSPKWFYELVNRLIENSKFKFNVANSILDNKPLY